MNTDFYLYFIDLCWLVIGAYWLINAFNTKQTIRKQSLALRWAYLLALAFSFVLLYSPFHQISWLIV